jgi:hypothetical protein
MKEVTLSFTEEELLELARQLYMAGFFMIYYDDYPFEKLARALELKICSAGFGEFNEKGDYEYGGSGESIFRLSIDQGTDLEDVVEALENNAIQEYIPDRLAFRDIKEKHGNMTEDELVYNTELYKEYEEICNMYKMELLLNGIENFRLFKTPTN